MELKQRIEALVRLGEQLKAGDETLDAIIHRSSFHNPWFTQSNQRQAIKAIAENFLSRKNLEQWLASYDWTRPPQPKTIGLVMAGNIPLVGFHDVLCVFISGHKCLIKLSEKDPYLLPHILKMLSADFPQANPYFEFVEKLQNFDAVIATGSNNSARYFEAYFGKYPHIIRRNRNSIGILTGAETDAELMALGTDIFSYFGLGCRNVSKVYIPEDFALKHFLEVLHEYRALIGNVKYKNNFDYTFALYSMNKVPFHINGCLILKEDASLHSRIACLHYEYYNSLEQLPAVIKAQHNKIQCVVSNTALPDTAITPFGEAQSPELWDYADGVDTLQFLHSL